MTTIVTIGKPDKDRHSEEELAVSVGFGDGLAPVDRKLLKLAERGKSGDEMERETGIPAAKAMERVRKILSNKSWLSAIEREEMFLLKLYEYAGTLEDIVAEESQIDGITGYDRFGREQYGRGDPRWASNLTKVYDLILRSLTTKMSDVTKVKAEITSSQAKAMGQVVETAFRDFAATLAEEYPEIPEQALRTMLEGSLATAFASLSSKVTTDDEDGE